MIKQFWLVDGPRQLLNWWTAPRNFGLKVVFLGLLFLLAPHSLEWVVQVVSESENAKVNVWFRSADIPFWLVQLCYAIGGLMVTGGLVLAGIQHFQDRRILSRRRVVVVEFRGMLDTTDTPLIAAAPSPALAIKDELLIDIRTFIEHGSIEKAVEAVARLPDRLKEKRIGRDRIDVSVVAGGLMPVPLQFYAGLLLDDEATVTLMDWRRHEGMWGALNEFDDLRRFEIDPLPKTEKVEVVVAVSASYMVDMPGIERTFGALPIVCLRLKDPIPNSLWSLGKQQALSQQFLEVAAQLAGRGTKRIHLVLAAPSSLSLQLGALYDRRNLPQLIVYQYERSNNPPYPWGLVMPTHGIAKAGIVPPPTPSTTETITLENVCPALMHT